MSDAGDAACWGWDQFAATTPPDVPAKWSAMAAGSFHTCGVGDEGQVVCFGGYKETVTQIPAQLRLAQSVRCGGVDAPPWTLGVLNVAVDLRLRGVNLAIGDAVAWVGADAQCGADNSLYSTLLEDLGEGLHRGVSADRRRANVTVVPRSSGALELCYGLRGVSRVDAARYPRLRLLSRTVTGPAAVAAHAGVPFAVRWEGDGIGVAGADVPPGTEEAAAWLPAAAAGAVGDACELSADAAAAVVDGVSNFDGAAEGAYRLCYRFGGAAAVVMPASLYVLPAPSLRQATPIAIDDGVDVYAGADAGVVVSGAAVRESDELWWTAADAPNCSAAAVGVSTLLYDQPRPGDWYGTVRFATAGRYILCYAYGDGAALPAGLAAAAGLPVARADLPAISRQLT